MKEDRVLKIYGFLHLWLFTVGILLVLLDVGGLLDRESAGKLLFLFLPLLVFREVSVRGKKIWSYLGVAVLFGCAFWFLGRNRGESMCLLLESAFLSFYFFMKESAESGRLFSAFLWLYRSFCPGICFLLSMRIRKSERYFSDSYRMLLAAGFVGEKPGAFSEIL